MRSRLIMNRVHASAAVLPLAIACSSLAAEPLNTDTDLNTIAQVPQLQMPAPIARPPLALCADPRIALSYTTLENGTVRLNGTVANRGTLALNVPIDVKYVMNVSYPPKTYSQVGISEQLCTQSFPGLAVGQVVTVNCSYQIPDFASWAPDWDPSKPSSPPPAATAKRLFTLAVVRADMAPFGPNQDCNPADTQASVELSYRPIGQ